MAAKGLIAKKFKDAIKTLNVVSKQIASVKNTPSEQKENIAGFERYRTAFQENGMDWLATPSKTTKTAPTAKAKKAKGAQG